MISEKKDVVRKPNSLKKVFRTVKNMKKNKSTESLDDWEMVNKEDRPERLTNSGTIINSPRGHSLENDLMDFHLVEDGNVPHDSFECTRDTRAHSLDEPTLHSHHTIQGLTPYVKKDLFHKTIVHHKVAQTLLVWKDVDIPKKASEAHVKLKYLIRKGIPKTKVRDVWLTLCGYFENEESNPATKLYFDNLLEVFHGEIPQLIHRYPLFGGVLSLDEHLLYNHATVIVKRLLSVLGAEFMKRKYMPPIPDITCLLLYYLKEEDAYFALVRIMKKSNKPHTFMLYNQIYWEAFIIDFDNLIKVLVPKVWTHMTKKLDMRTSKSFAERWFHRFFIADLPIYCVIRMFSGYLNEGLHVLYKVGLALLKTYKKQLLETTTAESFVDILRQYSGQLVDVDHFMKSVWSYSVSSYIKKSNVKSHAKAHMIVQNMPKRKTSFCYRPKILKPSQIFETLDWELIYDWIPVRFRIRDPSLLFSFTHDGRSLEHLYRKVGKTDPTIVFIESEQGRVKIFSNSNYTF